MEVFFAAAIVFGMAFLAMALGVIRGKHCPGCSCKAARRIMKEPEHGGCQGQLHPLSRDGQPPP